VPHRELKWEIPIEAPGSSTISKNAGVPRDCYQASCGTESFLGEEVRREFQKVISIRRRDENE